MTERPFHQVIGTQGTALLADPALLVVVRAVRSERR